MAAETSTTCPRCGTRLHGSFLGNICPRCMLEGAGTWDERPESALPDPAAELSEGWQVGARVGDYELIDVLGRGGMAVVYLARQISLDRLVALKTISAPLAADAHGQERFRREARAIAQLEHPRIVSIHDIGTSAGALYYTMDYIAGSDLGRAMQTRAIPIAEAASIVQKVAEAVAHANDREVLHRDLKPGNILIDEANEPHVTDFGIALDAVSAASLTLTGDVMGTPPYMAPEALAGGQRKSSPASEVYALGAILFHLLTGRTPFLGGSTSEILHLALTVSPPSPRVLNSAVPRDLEIICLKCLEKEPKSRYQTAAALAEDLRRFLAGEEIRGRPTLPPVRLARWVRRHPALVAVVALLALLLLQFFRPRVDRNAAEPIAATSVDVISDKSIAVLPFDNMNRDAENAYFADGMQDEILTTLAKISDLRVISRSSVMQYGDATKRNLPEVARALRVAHILEASVQRTQDRVRVNARLIDARNDVHVWAQTYDRDPAAVFAIQSEIAKSVATQLRAKILPVERTSIEEPPTADLLAFDLYTRAKTLVLTANLAVFKDQLLQAIDFLNQAVARDPEFFVAYCLLASQHDRLYFLGDDASPERKALAEEAVQAATRLRPDDGETHLALAQHFYNAYRDYDRARAEIALAQRTLPNDPRLFQLAGYIDRRQGRWEESARNHERALELDPRNFYALHQLSFSYQMLRRYAEMAAVLDRALAISPQDVDTRVKRALVDLYWRADTRPLHATIESVLAQEPAAAAKLADSWLTLAFYERDLAAAEQALEALTGNNFGYNVVTLTRNFGYGVLARLRGDTAAAQMAFTAARAEQEEVVRAQPEFGPALCVLGLIDAALGRKEQALREGRRAIELLPASKDSVAGPQMTEFFSITAAWAGENDLAIEQLKASVAVPGLLSYGQLKLHPFWDPLRRDPRFEKIVATIAPH